MTNKRDRRAWAIVLLLAGVGFCQAQSPSASAACLVTTLCFVAARSGLCSFAYATAASNVMGDTVVWACAAPARRSGPTTAI